MRQQIASALSIVPDVRGHSKRPAPPAEGDGWPVLGPLDRQGGTSFTATWRVRIVLPQDEDAASEWIDSHWPDLFYALQPLAHVMRAAPIMLDGGGGQFYALEITMIGEE